MKFVAKLLFPVFFPIIISAQFQHNQLDSMHRVVQQAANDTIIMDAYYKMGVYFDDVNLDSSIYYSEKGAAIARKLELKLNEAEMLTNTSFPLTKIGNYPKALNVLMQALKISESPSSEKNTWGLLKGQTPRTSRFRVMGYAYLGFGELYLFTGDYEKQLSSYFEGRRISESIKDTVLLSYFYADMGGAYNNLKKLDSALIVGKKALELFSLLSFGDRKFEGGLLSNMGGVYKQMRNLDLARAYFQRAIKMSQAQNNPALEGEGWLELARLYQTLNKPDSTLLCAQHALESFKIVGKAKEEANAYRMIAEYYWQRKNRDSSLAYLRLATVLNDSLDKLEKKKLQEFRVAGLNEELRVQELEKEKIQTKSKIRTYAMLAGIGVFMLIAFLLYGNNRNRKKANTLLQKQKEELQSTLSELKSTQSLLIQSEKMASLGELTAGIAHEIQNPLNFVNNFSEVNTELIEEARLAIDNGNISETKIILQDLKENEQKINHHGKRADSIVKGMLQHSRSSNSVKELTDINGLADEYLRLSYHGLRAKDKAFNATLQTDFDNSIGNVQIIPQDIGRVLLNLINNAFYAVTEKKRQLGSAFEPIVRIRTKKINNKIEICVKDNGNGIPKKILDKIFQPFFTTKPTGEGTGLGLSLAYDAVKAHGGELKVETRESEGTEFIIVLPIA